MYHHQPCDDAMDSLGDTMVVIDNNDNNHYNGDEKADKIKRPMNAFMLWSKLRRREISKNDPTIHNAQISKLLGEEWKVLPLEEKQPFLTESQKLMVKHKRDHPNYRYKPRKNKQERSVLSGGNTGGDIDGPGYNQKAYVLPTQAKPYSRYNGARNRYNYGGSSSSSSSASSSPSSRRLNDNHLHENRGHHSLPKHHPIIYYQGYKKCHIPGCYECDYERPYEIHHRPRLNLSPYHYNENEYQTNRNIDTGRCLCCSQPPPPPPYMGCISKANHHQHTHGHVHGQSKRRNNFSVESLIKNRSDSPDYPSSLSGSKSNHPSPGSPGSASSTGCSRRNATRDEKQTNGNNSGSEGKYDSES